MSMGKNRKKWLVGGCLGIMLLGLLAALVAGWLVLDPGSPLNRGSSIKATREWARLADFPPTVEDLRIETTGSMFTREFKISFRDTPTNVLKWINASPGPSSAMPSTDAGGWRIYNYPAGGGAVFAEVRVSPSGEVVRIRTYWS